MAYVPASDQEEKQANGTATPQVGAALPTTGGGEGTAPVGGMTPSAPKSATQGFANINQYLGANQDQAANVAGSVASNLGTQFTGLQNDINSAADTASQAVTAGSTPYNEGFVNNALANSAEFTSNPNNLAAWQKQYAANYTGPAAFENTANYGKAASAANKAGQTYQLGQTGGGYTQLLNQIEKNPTAGRTALDKSLIQADPNAQQTIQGALTPFKGINDYISGKSAEIGKQVSDAAKQAQETSAKTKAATTNATSIFQNNLANDTTNRVQKSFPGLPAEGINNITSGIGQQNLMYAAAKPEEYDRAEALARLQGGVNTYLPSVYKNQNPVSPVYQNLLDTIRSNR